MTSGGAGRALAGDGSEDDKGDDTTTPIAARNRVNMMAGII
jgi:hypothetical protein